MTVSADLKCNKCPHVYRVEGADLFALEPGELTAMRYPCPKCGYSEATVWTVRAHLNGEIEMGNRIELQSKADYDRAIAIEREVIEETNWKPPQHETSTKFVTYPVPELADEVRARLSKEGITYQ